MATMPSKKRKYNARFPAGRIKKIMQTDEEVGKVAQAVPIIISRTLELFVESLLGKALQVTLNRNAKTLSPSHVKQCILGESRFDFLRDLVKNIPDVSAAEEKELLSAESSPTSSRFSEASTQSNCDSRVHTTPPPTPRDNLKRAMSAETEMPSKALKIEPLALTAPVRSEPYFPAKTEPSPMPEAIDLTKKPIRTANFYQETLVEEVEHKSVIKLNPTYSSPQPSTSYTNVNPVPALHRIEIPVPKPSFDKQSSISRNSTPRTPITPIINIDFSKNLIPEIKVLDTASVPKEPPKVKVSRQNSKSKIVVKKVEIKPIPQSIPVDIDVLNSGNLQIDEDYDT